MKRLLAGLMIAGIVFATKANAAEQTVNRLVGKPAPLFTATALDGQVVSLTNLKGKTVLINFWATWCPPCRQEVPDLIRFRREYVPKGVEIIGISLDKDKAALTKFVLQNKISYPVVKDESQIAALYGGCQFIPTTFLVDRQGVVRGMHIGSINYQQLVEWVTPYLN